MMRERKIYMNDKIDDRIFDFIYTAALRDATLQKSFFGKKKVLNENFNAKSIVRKYINDIIDGKTVSFYETAKLLIKSFEQFMTNEQLGGEFTFGNAQKLLNMAVKYVFSGTYFNRDFRKKFKECHCPIDNRIISTVLQKIKELKEKKELDTMPKKFADMVEHIKNGFLRTSWSKMRIVNERNEQYDQLQYLIRQLALIEGLYPLEYDYVHWNEELEE